MALCLSCPSDVFPRPPTPSSNATVNLEPYSLLQECTNSYQLKQIHAIVIRHKTSKNLELISNKLIQLYSSYGQLDYARNVFNQMPHPKTFTWNLMIRAYTINNSSYQALTSYNHMITSGISPDKFTFPFAIKACVSCSAIEKGKEVHAFAIKAGYYKDTFVKNTLMDLYLKCGELNYGRKVFEKMPVRNVVSWTTMLHGLINCGDIDSARILFDEMPQRNVVSWTAMINGYVNNRRPEDAFDLFWKMRELDGVRPNEFTLISLLKACTELGSLKLGVLVHKYAITNGYELGVYLGTALIDMYSKCGSMVEARRVFYEMENRSVATWNSMITSLGVHGCGEEALVLFERMLEEELSPDAITFVGVLCACVQSDHVFKGLTYFTYMTECCGIVPILEHYVCMFQLWDRSKKN